MATARYSFLTKTDNAGTYFGVWNSDESRFAAIEYVGPFDGDGVKAILRLAQLAVDYDIGAEPLARAAASVADAHKRARTELARARAKAKWHALKTKTARDEQAARDNRTVQAALDSSSAPK